jgi:hypothetical protein
MLLRSYAELADALYCERRIAKAICNQISLMTANARVLIKFMQLPENESFDLACFLLVHVRFRYLAVVEIVLFTKRERR